MKNKIMEKVMSGEVRMKPRWYFIAGSIISFFGLVGLILAAIFFTNLTLFLLLKRGPGTGRLLMLTESFPLWVPVFAVILIILGTVFLKRYDFSYKKNRTMVVFLFVMAIILSALTIYFTGLDDLWFKRGPMRKYFSKDYPNVTFRHQYPSRP